MVCVAVVALAASACGNGTPSTPTRTPTELSPLLAGTVTALAAPTRTPVPMASPDTSPPFTITGPMDQAVALTQDTLLRAGNYFVLDLQSRLV
jgi:D-serine deaminase-like pyridoxal phosphate-dependent protein